MNLNPRPDPGMLREMSSSIEGLEEAAVGLQAASEWAVEGHFLVTTRALLRCESRSIYLFEKSTAAAVYLLAFFCRARFSLVCTL